MSWEFQGELPSIVKIDGADYYIHSDYRVSIEFAELMESDLKDDEKWIRALELYFGGIPQNINAAVESIVSFYSCGKDAESIQNVAAEQEDIRVVDLRKDMPYIYAAFLDQYKIDLYETQYLHWWQFMAMFKGLRKDARIVEIMGYRSAKEESWMSKEQKAEIRRMHRIWDLDKRSDSDRKADEEFLKMIQESGDIASYLAVMEE